MTLIDADTGEVIAECTTDEARQLTDRIRTSVSDAWAVIAEAYQRQAHRALGYPSWDAYVAAEFGAARLRLPREERAEVVASLRDQGLSIRAIAAATGHDTKTVQKDLRLSQVSESPTPEPEVEPNFKGTSKPKPAPPKPVTGRDGKSYQPKPQPEMTAEEQRARDIDAAYKRAARYLEQLTDVWPYFIGGWQRNRDEIAKYLVAPTIEALDKIEEVVSL